MVYLFMNKMVKNSLGLVQIPIMIGLLLMAVAIPAVTSLVQQNQENRGKAMEVDGCNNTTSPCGKGYNCVAGACKWVGVPTAPTSAIATSKPTAKPTAKPTNMTCGSSGCVTSIPTAAYVTPLPTWYYNNCSPSGRHCVGSDVWNCFIAGSTHKDTFISSCQYGCASGACRPAPTAVLPTSVVAPSCNTNNDGEVKCINTERFNCICNNVGVCVWSRVLGGAPCGSSTPIPAPTSNQCLEFSKKCIGTYMMQCICDSPFNCTYSKNLGGPCTSVTTAPTPINSNCPGYCVQGGLCNQGDKNSSGSYSCSNSLSICCTKETSLTPTSGAFKTCKIKSCKTYTSGTTSIKRCDNEGFATVRADVPCPKDDCDACGGPIATITVRPENTPVLTSTPNVDSCGRGWSCTSKSSGICINAGGDVNSCRKSNGATGNCCIPSDGGQPVATNTPGSGGGNPPNATSTPGGGGNNNNGGGGGGDTASCTECSKDFKCYSNGTEYKWFVNGYVMTGFTKVTTGTNVTTCNGVAKPTFLGKSKGDANCDGTINTSDYSLWHTEFYSGDAGSIVKKTWNADFTGINGKCDGKVDVRDFSLWHTNFIY